MSFKAKLSVGGNEVNVLSCCYDFSQEVDATGRPSAITRGGRIKLEIESTAGSFFAEWMCDNFTRFDGKVTFLKRDTDAKMKEVTFTEGYLVKYEESFEGTNRVPMTESFTISCRELGIGNATFANDWIN